MADLLASRFQDIKPFPHTGVDFAGPFSVTTSKHQGIKTQKVYLCLLVFLSVKAIHLELASELSSECIMNCFKRFLARRGPVLKMFNDRGVNFVGVKHELDNIYNWSFNPP